MTKHALPLACIATLLMVGLAPEFRTVEDLFYRLFFLLAAVSIGYFIQRRAFLQKHRKRLKTAFTSPRHRAEWWWRKHKSEILKTI